MSVKELVLQELEQNKGNYISGGQLAEKLSVSRNSIWKAIKALEKSGYTIEAKPNTGYMLSAQSDILSPQSINKYLKHNLDIKVYDSVSSTNTLLLEMANNGAPEGTILIANEQTKGKGRIGKSFYSPKGTGIYLSILLRPTIPATESLFLTTSTAVAVAKAIEKVSNKNAQIKWVNDIYIDSKKVCGILTEASINVESMNLDYAVIGVGINVSFPENGFPDDIKTIATAVFDKETDSINMRSKLIAYVLDYLLDYYNDFNSKEYVKEYISRSLIIGKKISVIENNRSINAIALEIDDQCRLKVKLENGETKWLSSGEVSIRI